MEINGIAQLATSMARERTEQDVSVAVLRTALDVQQGTAAALLAALPQPVAAANLPPHVGQNVNTTA
ncbi:MAG: YjfB family protein [Burkholderiaceae bacterium]